MTEPTISLYGRRGEANDRTTRTPCRNTGLRGSGAV